MNLKKRIAFLASILTVIGINHLSSQDQNITISSKSNSDNSVDISYRKELPGSYYVSLEFTTLRNSYPTRFEGVIKDKSGSLLRLKPIDSDKRINYGYSYTTTRGVPNPKIDSEFTYALPFQDGKKVLIKEAYNVGEKHFGSERPSNWKYYIVDSKSADTICSMRKGIVVEIKNEFREDTTFEKTYTSDRNSMVIEHDDGTYASYKGFRKNTFLVELGQTVYPNTKLGVMDIFNKDNYRIDFAIYYLIDTDFKHRKNQTLSNAKSLYEYLNPYFITQNGIKKMESRNEYTAKMNESILFQEFSKRERKKYIKNTELFE